MKSILLSALLTAIALSLGMSQALAQTAQEVPEEDRKFVAEILRKALAGEMATAKLATSSEERHREEIGPKFARIVTYWRSKVAAEARFPNPAQDLTVSVPSMLRGESRTVIKAVASAPIVGTASGQVMEDGGHKIAGTSTGFRSLSTIAAEFSVTRAGAGYQIQILSWEPKFKDTHFDDSILDRLRGPIEKLVNEKLKDESDKLRAKANDALKKAYEEGKLKLDVAR